MGDLGESAVPLRIAMLGSLAVTHGGRLVPVRGAKKCRLLAGLLVEPNRPVPAEHLARCVWGEVDLVDDWENRLETAISRLRSSLPVAGGGARIVWAGAGYRLILARDELDVFEFDGWREDAADALEAGQPERAVRFAEAALAQWRGRPFGELADEPFAVGRVRTLEAHRRSVQQIHVEAMLEIGRHDEAVPIVERLVAAEPENERLRELLARGLYGSGHAGAALSVIRRYRDNLRKRTGRDPGRSLDELEVRILNHDPALSPGPAPPLGTTGPRTGTGTGPGTGRGTGTARDRPSGPKTFLFTGAVGRTAGPGTAGPGPAPEREADEAAFQAHKSELRAAIAAHRGHVFDRAELCAVFEHPLGAVLAARDAALALQRFATAQRSTLRVTMAVHTGTAAERGRSFAGPNVVHAARLRDAGHPGQVLISAATRELVADELPLGVRLRDIGPWQFDGSPRPDRVYQLTHDDLDAEFPPLRIGQQHTGRLPRYTTTFVGRAEQQAATVHELQQDSLVTITGDGGIGKTRLALEVAARASAGEFPDGVWFCDVSLADDTSTLVGRIAESRGLLLPSVGDHRREVVGSFETAQLLFVLDGCEQLREPVAELVGEVLASGSKARFLVTSRAPLGVPAEQVVKLDTLAVPDPSDPEPELAPAVQLLLDRAASAGARVDPGDPHLVELARRLDGLPLAIELAATHLASTPAVTLVDRLDRYFETFSGAPGVPDRHRTLRATFEWSFNLVSPAARRLLAALSQFRGTWTLERAEAVATAVDVETDRVMAVVAELVDQSIVRVQMPAGGTARNRMLDTIRAFAAEHLVETGRHDAVADLHADHFLDLAERAVPHRRGPHEPAWSAEVAAELDDLRAAHRHFVATARLHDGLRLVVALADDVLMRERLEIGRWAAELVVLPGVADDPLRVEALGVAANATMLEGRLDVAADLARTALHLEAAAGAPPTWMARNVLAMTSAVQADPGWIDHVRAMEAISDARGDPFPRALALWDRAFVAEWTGRAERGEAAAQELLDLGDRHDNPSMRSMGLLARGRVAKLRGDVGAARGLFQQALGAAEAARTTLVVNQVLRELASLGAHVGAGTGALAGALAGAGAGPVGDHLAALATLARIARTFTDSGNLAEQAQTARSMVDHLLALGEVAPAATALVVLARTPMSTRAGFLDLVESVLARLTPAERDAVQREGGATSLHHLIADLVQVVVDLTDEEDTAP